MLLCATLVATALPRSSASGSTVERVLPPGQEELLAQMLGHGAALPADCRFAGGKVDGMLVSAEYACGDHPLVLELRDRNDAPPSAPRTQHFAIVVRSGAAPSGLLEALAVLIRSREAALEWQPAPGPPTQGSFVRLGPLGVLGIAGVILVIGLVAQSVLVRPLPPRRGVEERGPRRTRRRHGRVLSIVCLIAVYLFTRLLFLTRWPVYVDESAHIDWARGPLGQAFEAEFSVGRWLPVRLMALFVSLPFEPLFSARLGSVAMGLATLGACVVTNRRLFSWTEGLLAGVVYAALPYTFLYDRFALTDIYLTAFGAWALVFAIAMIDREGRAVAVGMGLSTSAAILSKPTGALFLATPLLVSVFLVGRGARVAYLKRIAPTVIAGTVLVLFLVQGGYGAGLLTSQAAFEGRAQIERVLLPNLEVARQWLTALLTPTVAGLTMVAIGGAVMGIFVGARAEGFLVALLLVSVMPYALISRTWYPSYLLFAVVPISLLLARAFTVGAAAAARLAAARDPRLALPARRAVCVILSAVLVGAAAPLDLVLLTRPEAAALPSIESTRYISGGLSGYGLPELAAFLRAQAQRTPINVVRFDLMAPPRNGLDVYLSATDALHLYTIDHRAESAAARIASLASARRTLFVSNPEGEEALGVTAARYLGRTARIWSYVRPGAQSRLEVWEVQPGA